MSLEGNWLVIARIAVSRGGPQYVEDPTIALSTRRCGFNHFIFDLMQQRPCQDAGRAVSCDHSRQRLFHSSFCIIKIIK